MIKLFLKIRQNGCKHLQHNVEIRQVVYFNMIWMFSYLTILINTIAALLIYQNHYSFFILSSLVVQAFFWIAYTLVHYNKSNIAKYLFLLIIYLTISWYDHFYGKYAYTSLYFFAFLPTAFNIFSVRRNTITVIIYLLMPLGFVLFAEFYGYKNFSTNIWSDVITNQMRITNVVISFMLFALYSAYMILNSGFKQNKLITQSVGLQTTLDNAIGAIWSIDANYNILAVNKAFLEFTQKEFGVHKISLGANLKAFVSSSIMPATLKNHYQKVLEGCSMFENFEFNGKVFELKSSPIIEATSNKVVGATFNCRDITKKVAADEILLQAKQKAEEASHAKERFLSNMSHELRTPLNGIVGITNIMLDEVYLPQQKQNFETLKTLSDHTLGVVNNILDISKIDAEKTILNDNRFNLILFIKKLQSIFENTAKLKKIDFGIEVEGDADIFLRGDEIKLSQVLINLLGNSIKFTEKGFSKLNIKINENRVESGFTNLYFSVSDSGIGIHKKHQEKIFESFTQADENTTRKFGGSGLGITISEKILHLMNSKLHVESELGKGSTFSFEIALKKSSFIPKNKLDLKNTTDYSLPNTNILLAEDNKINQIVAKRFLEKWNAMVTIVENGKQAVEAALANQYDIILMDLDMPIMDGYEATALIKEQNSSIPIIALTAASFENMQEYLIKKGFVDVVQKPFMPDEFYKKLSSILQIS
jgi:signal transduction histidine kinase/CheY-like chemotaxis protein/PAS domain-containing protein